MNAGRATMSKIVYYSINNVCSVRGNTLDDLFAKLQKKVQQINKIKCDRTGKKHKQIYHVTYYQWQSDI